MATTYYWNLKVHTGLANDGTNWINAATGTTGTTPGLTDTAEIGASGAATTVSLLARGPVQTLALGGSGGGLATLVIGSAGTPLKAGLAVGSITDSFTIASTGETFSGGGTVALRNDGGLLVRGTVAADITVTFDGSADVLVLAGTSLAAPNPDAFAGQVTGFGGAGEIVLNTPYAAADTLSYAAGILHVSGPGGTDLLDIRINLPTAGFMLTSFAGYPGLTGHDYLAMVAAGAGERWTNGAARLRLQGGSVLEVHLAGTLEQYAADDARVAA